MNCADIVRIYVNSLGERFECSERDSTLLITSPFLHPDGDTVEILVNERQNGRVEVTDVGETIRHLSSLAFDPRSNAKSDFLLSETLKQNNVEVFRGALRKEVPEAEVGEAIQDVLSAALGVSHLIYLSRGYRPKTFQEEVAYLLKEAEVQYEQGSFEFGESETRYKVDFKIGGDAGVALIQALSPTSVAGTRPMVNSAFRMFSDIRRGPLKVVILDDRYVTWRTEDLKLLTGVSRVFNWTSDYLDISQQIINIDG